MSQISSKGVLFVQQPEPKVINQGPFKTFRSSTLWTLAILGIITFVILQIIIPAVTEPALIKPEKAITKQAASESAAEFATSVLKISGHLENPLVTYKTHSDVFGYLSKEDLLNSYVDQYEKQFPYDVFQVRFNEPAEHLSALTVDVHMTTGKVVGFEQISSFSNTSKDLMLELGVESEETLLTREGDLSLADKTRLATPYLAALQYDQLDLEAISQENSPGLLYRVSGYQAGAAEGQIKFQFEYGAVSSMEPSFSIPTGHTDYVKGQSTLALWLTFGGYGLFTFVLAILAIVYAALTRAHTSFKRGIFLASVHFIISMIMLVNTMPLLKNQSPDSVSLMIIVIVQCIVNLFMSASIYFSLVGGDGLWKQQGLSLWPRAKEPGYGRHIMKSMKDGYAWAFILMGVQSILFFILEHTIAMWSTTDESQSLYNMAYPLLLPLAAWFAGIGEEAVYRLFGIPMLKKMFRSTWVAATITTIIWALGHTLYPIYPVYSRPIELLFLGLLFSFIFLRYGFATAVFAHVIFDSILMSFSLMAMGEPVYLLAAVFYIALPAIVAYIIYRFNPKSKEVIPPPMQKEEEPFITTPPHPEGQL